MEVIERADGRTMFQCRVCGREACLLQSSSSSSKPAPSRNGKSNIVSNGDSQKRPKNSYDSDNDDDNDNDAMLMTNGQNGGSGGGAADDIVNVRQLLWLNFKMPLMCGACKKFYTRCKAKLKDDVATVHECTCPLIVQKARRQPQQQQQQQQTATASKQMCWHCRFQRCQQVMAERGSNNNNNSSKVMNNFDAIQIVNHGQFNPGSIAHSTASSLSPPLSNNGPNSAGQQSNSSSQNNNSSSNGENVNVRLIPCQVCGASSSGYHFGVISCEGCKGFFRRSLTKHEAYTCSRQPPNNAPVAIKIGEHDALHQSKCKLCRWKACLGAGMSTDAVRTGRHSIQRKMETSVHMQNLAAENKLLQETVFRRDHRRRLIKKSRQQVVEAYRTGPDGQMLPDMNEYTNGGDFYGDGSTSLSLDGFDDDLAGNGDEAAMMLDVDLISDATQYLNFNNPAGNELVHAAYPLPPNPQLMAQQPTTTSMHNGWHSIGAPPPPPMEDSKMSAPSPASLLQQVLSNGDDDNEDNNNNSPSTTATPSTSAYHLHNSPGSYYQHSNVANSVSPYSASSNHNSNWTNYSPVSSPPVVERPLSYNLMTMNHPEGFDGAMAVNFALNDTVMSAIVEATQRLNDLRLSRCDALTFEMSLADVWTRIVKSSFEPHLRTVSLFIRQLPGFQKLRMLDRMRLFSNSYFPILLAVLSLDFDAYTGNVNYFCMPDFTSRRVFKKLFGCDQSDVNERQFRDAGHSMVQWAPNFLEFGVLCGLLFFNPEVGGLDDAGIVRHINRAYRLADDHFNQRYDHRHQRMQNFSVMAGYFEQMNQVFALGIENMRVNHPELLALHPLFKEVHSLLTAPPLSIDELKAQHYNVEEIAANDESHH